MEAREGCLWKYFFNRVLTFEVSFHFAFYIILTLKPKVFRGNMTSYIVQTKCFPSSAISSLVVTSNMSKFFRSTQSNVWIHMFRWFMLEGTTRRSVTSGHKQPDGHSVSRDQADNPDVDLQFQLTCEHHFEETRCVLLDLRPALRHNWGSASSIVATINQPGLGNRTERNALSRVPFTYQQRFTDEASSTRESKSVSAPFLLPRSP